MNKNIGYLILTGIGVALTLTEIILLVKDAKRDQTTKTQQDADLVDLERRLHNTDDEIQRLRESVSDYKTILATMDAIKGVGEPTPAPTPEPHLKPI